MEGLEYFENIEKYAAKNFSKNPVLVENSQKIKEISENIFIFSGNDCGCPLTKEKCDIAKLNAENGKMGFWLWKRNWNSKRVNWKSFYSWKRNAIY